MARPSWNRVFEGMIAALQQEAARAWPSSMRHSTHCRLAVLPGRSDHGGSARHQGWGAGRALQKGH